MTVAAAMAAFKAWQAKKKAALAKAAKEADAAAKKAMDKLKKKKKIMKKPAKKKPAAATKTATRTLQLTYDQLNVAPEAVIPSDPPVVANMRGLQ